MHFVPYLQSVWAFWVILCAAFLQVLNVARRGESLQRDIGMGEFAKALRKMDFCTNQSLPSHFYATDSEAVIFTKNPFKKLY